MQRYNPKDIEPKWQQQWEADKIYQATEDPAKPKKYILEYFPYPSGAAMHVGHVRNYTIGDVLARYNRMAGFNVLHPMGWDGFGLPAENYAIKNKVSPRQAIDENTTRFKEQLMQMGFSYDWSREIDSTDPSYYRWTQWFFLLLFKRGLAYQKESLQWWCPHDKTVLANEQVEAGVCWRCGNVVEKKALKQWFFKITEYADRLDKDLDDVNWSESIKAMQRNWIGRSKGVEITFQIAGFSDDLTVFTTRPDTLYGATFMVISPEHPLVAAITGNEQKAAVEAYVKQAQAKSDVERQETDREKTGVFTGAYAINPINQENIPIWIADYVLYGYGTGAIMAVPAHDERDFAFAKKFNLPIRQVLAPELGIRRDNETFAEGGSSVVFNPSTQKYAFPRFDDGSSRTALFAGGVKPGEDLHTGILRELREESGLTDIKHYEEILTVYGHYYHTLKDVNRRAKATGLLVVLQSADTVATELEAHEKFHLEWLDAADVLASWQQDLDKNYEHYILLLKQAVARAIELGYDTTSDPRLFTYSAVTGEGVMVNSGAYNGLESSDARELIVADLAQPPLPVYDDERNPLKPNSPTKERYAVQAIVRHPQEEKYLLLKLLGWDTETYSLPMGGIDDGEDATAAALRELREETGYDDTAEPHEITKPYIARFYHEFKKENRQATVRTVAVQLRSLRQAEIAEADKDLHQPLWVSLNELKDKVHGQGVKLVIDAYRSGESSVPFPTKPVGREVTNYKIRDWLISRQRYWGAPIPIIHCPVDGAVAVPDDQLPVTLPEIESYEPSGDGRSPLANVAEFVNTICPTCGGPAKRETDTMDGFACSSWYFLRFADPHNGQKAFDTEKARFWLPVDDYIGGAEHAVMHLLYARFWTKVMFDEGLINFEEPFKTLRNHGMILAPDGAKMSKSKGNTIEPGGLIDQGYGADAIRIMELFIGPWNQMANWSIEGMGGAHRFLQRIWTLVQEFNEAVAANRPTGPANEAMTRVSHKTIKKVDQDLQELSFNTSIAALMELVNELYKHKAADAYAAPEWRFVLETLLQLLAPFAPHIAEELWQQLGRSGSVHQSRWPKYDEKYLIETMMTIVVQVNGKVRAQLQQPTGAKQTLVEAAAQSETNVAVHMAGKTIAKTIFVPGKLINFVVK